MKEQTKNVKLTNELYLEMSNDTANEIITLKQNKDDKSLEIEGRLEYLRELNSRLKTAKNTLREEKRELKRCLKTIKHNIRLEKRAIKKNKHEKFSINRSLSKKFRYATKVNKAFSNDHVVQQKAR